MCLILLWGGKKAKKNKHIYSSRSALLPWLWHFHMMLCLSADPVWVSQLGTQMASMILKIGRRLTLYKTELWPYSFLSVKSSKRVCIQIIFSCTRGSSNWTLCSLHCWALSLADWAPSVRSFRSTHLHASNSWGCDLCVDVCGMMGMHAAGVAGCENIPLSMAAGMCCSWVSVISPVMSDVFWSVDAFLKSSFIAARHGRDANGVIALHFNDSVKWTGAVWGRDDLLSSLSRLIWMLTDRFMSFSSLSQTER